VTLVDLFGTEAILPVGHIMDRTCYGWQQDWEESPEGWPQVPDLRLNGRWRLGRQTLPQRLEHRGGRVPATG
jgi:hypothetical protein